MIPSPDLFATGIYGENAILNLGFFSCFFVHVFWLVLSPLLWTARCHASSSNKKLKTGWKNGKKWTCVTHWLGAHELLFGHGINSLCEHPDFIGNCISWNPTTRAHNLFHSYTVSLSLLWPAGYTGIGGLSWSSGADTIQRVGGIQVRAPVPQYTRVFSIPQLSFPLLYLSNALTLCI